ncbi:phosphoribosylpyrophosphate synthetase [Catalinimonas sp. 4WD22]|uniref:phosphoribosylpyrophosphate synthetase n=1 Tax=Catalinimonas locisalis TaxID=3133978 RepID=UPI003100B3F9
MNTYETVSEAVNHLIKRGYTIDFSLYKENDCLICKMTSLTLAPDEFEIDEIHRFEGMTDPGDEMVVYAISSAKHQAKGIVVNAFGIYSDAASSKIVERLSRHL